jgi:hypothetical protein
MMKHLLCVEHFPFERCDGVARERERESKKRSKYKNESSIGFSIKPKTGIGVRTRLGCVLCVRNNHDDDKNNASIKERR